MLLCVVIDGAFIDVDGFVVVVIMLLFLLVDCNGIVKVVFVHLAEIITVVSILVQSANS